MIRNIVIFEFVSQYDHSRWAFEQKYRWYNLKLFLLYRLSIKWELDRSLFSLASLATIFPKNHEWSTLAATCISFYPCSSFSLLWWRLRRSVLSNPSRGKMQRRHPSQPQRKKWKKRIKSSTHANDSIRHPSITIKLWFVSAPFLKESHPSRIFQQLNH